MSEFQILFYGSWAFYSIAWGVIGTDLMKFYGLLSYPIAAGLLWLIVVVAMGGTA